jgi:hypothetical protein
MGGAEPPGEPGRPEERTMEARIEIVNVGADTAHVLSAVFADLEAAHAYAVAYPGAYWNDLEVADDGGVSLTIAVE